MFQNSAFSTNSDEQYRQLYHPTENYRTLTYDTPTSHSPVTNFAPASPGGMVNPVMNGVTGNAANRSALANLGTIREEHNAHSGSQPNGVKSTVRNTQTNSPHVQGNTEKGQNPRQQIGTVSNKPIIDSQSNQQTMPSKLQTASETSILSSDQSQGAELGGLAANQRKEGPKFTIAGTSEDSDTSSSPPPKGKFYI